MELLIFVDINCTNYNSATDLKVQWQIFGDLELVFRSRNRLEILRAKDLWLAWNTWYWWIRIHPWSIRRPPFQDGFRANSSWSSPHQSVSKFPALLSASLSDKTKGPNPDVMMRWRNIPSGLWRWPTTGCQWNGWGNTTGYRGAVRWLHRKQVNNNLTSIIYRWYQLLSLNMQLSNTIEIKLVGAKKRKPTFLDGARFLMGRGVELPNFHNKLRQTSMFQLFGMFNQRNVWHVCSIHSEFYLLSKLLKRFPRANSQQPEEKISGSEHLYSALSNWPISLLYTVKLKVQKFKK